MTEAKPSPSNMETSARAMASLLGATDPARLADLRERFPSDRDLFETTYTLGAGSETATDGISPSRQLALEALIEATLRAGDTNVADIVRILSARMQRGRTIRLGAALATGVAGALTAAPALGAALPLPTLLGPGLALVGGMSMLVGEHWEKPLAGTQRSLGELLVDTLVAEATFADVRLRMAAEDLSRDGVVLELARRVGEAAAKLRHVSVFGGVRIDTAAA
jgi:hypothetical protein